MHRPTVALDTSALDWIVRNSDSEPFLAALLSGYSIRIPDTAFKEVIATRNRELRVKLLAVCRQLLRKGGCLLPAHWLLDLHVKHFHASPAHYNWRQGKVRADFLETEIQTGEFASAARAVEQQASEAKRLQDEFEGWFKRPVDKAGGSRSFAEWLVHSQEPGGSFWNTAHLLFEGACGPTSAMDKHGTLPEPPCEATLKAFLKACPPVRVLVYALELTLYNRCFRIEKSLAYKAGRNDQIMAVYLPYCDQFLTCDLQQQRCLQVAAGSANIAVKVRYVDEFWSSHMLGVG